MNHIVAIKSQFPNFLNQVSWIDFNVTSIIIIALDSDDDRPVAILRFTHHSAVAQMNRVARDHVVELHAIIFRRGETSDGCKDECTELRECASAPGKRTEFDRADWPVISIPMILSHRPLLPSPLFSSLPFVTGDDFNPRIVTRFRVSSTCGRSRSRQSHVDQLAANQWLRFVFPRGYRNTDNGGLLECQGSRRRRYLLVI